MSHDAWLHANQRYLTAALEEVRVKLERLLPQQDGAARAEAAGEERASLEDAARAMPSPPALEILCAAFGLSRFERDVLLLCAGVELSSAIPALCAGANGDPRKPFPTFSLALAALPDAHWSALGPAAPLRRFRLVDVDRDGGLTRGALRIDEWVLHWLAGTPALDEPLRALATPLPPPGELPPSLARVAERVVRIGEGPLAGAAIQLCGADRATRRQIAAAAAARRGDRAYAVRAANVPAAAAERDLVASLWEREALLVGTTLVLEIDDDDPPEAVRAAALLAERAALSVIVSGASPVRPGGRPAVRVDAAKPTRDEQKGLWDALVGADRAGEIDRVAAHFDLGAEAIGAACAHALSDPAAANGAPGEGGALWDACRAQARPRLGDLAQRIEPSAGWDDLVLPPAQLAVLREIAVHVRYRAAVYDGWGFGRGARGLGISALFAGASGTGKTMAAEVLAGVLAVDLWRVDLSQVVSKYIGETEKNLRRVFDAAEEGAAILLFDEADALFGKRSEVKDSHDRYANIEVSYLLQRMESYRGLAILTTNMKEALDAAFLRRIRFVVQFPFPDAEHRRAIWQRVFPAGAPTQGLDCGKLARLDVAGGNIRNIALNAAFLAAGGGEPVRMNHVLRAARSEYAKLQKPLTEVDMGGIE